MYVHLSCLNCQSRDTPVLNMLERLALTSVQITSVDSVPSACSASYCSHNWWENNPLTQRCSPHYSTSVSVISTTEPRQIIFKAREKKYDCVSGVLMVLSPKQWAAKIEFPHWISNWKFFPFMDWLEGCSHDRLVWNLPLKRCDCQCIVQRLLQVRCFVLCESYEFLQLLFLLTAEGKNY